jgi:ribose transport system substrate-binding protein
MIRLLFITLFFVSTILASDESDAKNKKIAYIVSDIRIPFWEIMSRGIKTKADSLGWEVEIYSASNIKKDELQNTASAIKQNVDGIIVSPINSSTCVTISKLAKKANIPVVIADIGSDENNSYISYISSDNHQGAYEIGKVLTKKMKELKYDKNSVGIIAIPQTRANGKARTEGFIKALNEANITSVAIEQQVDFSYDETYKYSKNMIDAHKDLKALWLQGSDRYQAALDAIKGSKRDILLITFDAEPIFLDLIPKGILVGAAMQQPFVMGEKALEVLSLHLNKKEVPKNIKLEILAISQDNIDDKLHIIKRNVLGVE